jgi:hypothetical protein
MKRRSARDDHDSPSSKSTTPGTDPFGIISVIFGSISMLSMLLTCCTCGISAYGATAFALIGGILGLFGRGSLRVVGLTFNILCLIPAATLSALIAMGVTIQALNPSDGLRTSETAKAQRRPSTTTSTTKPTTQLPTGQPDVQPPVQRSPRPSRGEEGILLVDSAPDSDLLIAVDQAAFDQFTKFSLAKDRFGVGQLVASGKLLPVKPRTRILVIAPGILVYEVRVLEGDTAGRIGLISTEFVHR